MIVLAFDQPHATLICEGEQTVVTYPTITVAVNGTLIDSEKAPGILVGQTVAIARLPVKPAEERDEDTLQEVLDWTWNDTEGDVCPAHITGPIGEWTP